MIGTRVTQRREAKIALLVAAGWKLAHQNSIGGVTLHGLAREVGMRQPSLYEYFDSKHALFDAMFADGNRRLLEHLDRVALPRDPRAALKRFMRAFVQFAMEDAARYELLFERHIPGFEPSPHAYALAEEVLGRAVKLLHDVGLTKQGDVDCTIALVAGLMGAQMSNNPGGNRWTKHLDRLIDLYVDDALRREEHR